MIKSEYKNSVKSREQIKRSYMNLLEEGRDPKKITVKEISDKASITRGTFYNHYKSLSDVSDDVKKDFMDSLEKNLIENDFSQDGRKIFFIKLEEFMENNKEKIKVLSSSLSVDTILDLKSRFNNSIMNAITRKNKGILNDIDTKIKINIFSSGMACAFIDSISNSNFGTIKEVLNNSYIIFETLFSNLS